jgi:3-keto-disaccharide hydrolase
MTGVTWTNDLPRMNYEISLEAMRVDGSDFFCGLTFPVGEEPCSFIVGGWGGGVVGLSSIDNEDAAHNETTQYMNFTNGKWFAIRVKVTKTRIEAWIDSDKVVNLETEGKKISIRPEVELSKPLGIASWSTAAALRNIRIRRL